MHDLRACRLCGHRTGSPFAHELNQHEQIVFESFERSLKGFSRSFTLARLWLPVEQPSQVRPREDSRRRGLGVAFHAGELPREQEQRVVRRGEVGAQGAGRVDVGVPVQAAMRAVDRLAYSEATEHLATTSLD